MINLIKRLLNKTPKYLNNVWYNQSIWMTDTKYPIVFDSEKRYINCKVGLKVKMGENVYYTVVKMWRTSGSDWMYQSDAITCKLKFSHYESLK